MTLKADFFETWCYDWAYQRENRLIVAGDPIPDTDSGSSFQFNRHCRIGPIKAFYEIY